MRLAGFVVLPNWVCGEELELLREASPATVCAPYSHLSNSLRLPEQREVALILENISKVERVQKSMTSATLARLSIGVTCRAHEMYVSLFLFLFIAATTSYKLTRGFSEAGRRQAE